MPFNWNVDTERALLLITCADLKPGTSTWQAVANALGGGLNANAVSQKFYKLKKESEKLINSGGAAPSIPDPKKGGKKSSTSTTIQHKRKAKDDVTNNLNETSSKRTKKKVQNEVALDNNEHIVEIKSESDADESNDEVLRPVKLNPNDLVMEEEEDEKTAKEA